MRCATDNVLLLIVGIQHVLSENELSYLCPPGTLFHLKIKK